MPLIDGGTQRLPRVVGMGRALDLILTGRTIDAAEALAIGLADRASPTTRSPRALALAEEIAAFPQDTVRSDRRRRWKVSACRCDEGLALEARLGRDRIADRASRARPVRERRASAEAVHRRNSGPRSGIELAYALRILALASVALLLAAPAAATAGTYHVYTCAAGGKVYANGAWKTAHVARRRRGFELCRELDRAERARRREDGRQHVLGADVHEPGGHDDRGLRADPPDRLHEPGRGRYAQVLPLLRARPDGLRRRGQLLQPDPQRAQRAEAVVRLSGGQRRRRQERRDARDLPRAGGLQGRRQHARPARRLLQARQPVLGGHRRGRSATSCTAPT